METKGTRRFTVWQIIGMVIVWPVGIALLIHWLWRRSHLGDFAKISLTAVLSVTALMLVFVNLVFAAVLMDPSAYEARPVAKESPLQQPEASPTTVEPLAPPSPEASPTATEPVEPSTDRAGLPTAQPDEPAATPPRTVPASAAAPPVAVGPSADCIYAMVALEKAGADTLEVDAPEILATLRQCKSASDWLAGLHAVPGALGYTPSDLSPELARLDLEILCGGNTVLPACADA